MTLMSKELCQKIKSSNKIAVIYRSVYSIFLYLMLKAMKKKAHLIDMNDLADYRYGFLSGFEKIKDYEPPNCDLFIDQDKEPEIDDIFKTLDMLELKCTYQMLEVLCCMTIEKRDWKGMCSLISMGIDPSKIDKKLNSNTALSHLRIKSLATRSLVLLEDGSTAYMRLDALDFAKSGAKRSMCKDILDIGLSLVNVTKAVLVYEKNDRSFIIDIKNDRGDFIRLEKENINIEEILRQEIS